MKICIYSKKIKNEDFENGVILNRIFAGDTKKVYHSQTHTMFTDGFNLTTLWDYCKESLYEKYNNDFLYNSVVLKRGNRRIVFTR